LLSTRKPKTKTQTQTKTQEQHTLNDNVEDVKHNPQSSKLLFDLSTVSTNKKPHPWLIFTTVLSKLSNDIENDIENDTDTDTTATTAQNHIVDKVVAATHSADHTMVSSEKQEEAANIRCKYINKWMYS
jgi:hypothetical protein